MPRDRGVYILAILSLLPAVLIWIPDYLPFADYPNHLARVWIMRSLPTNGFYASHFTSSYFDGILPIPNLIFDLFTLKLVPFLNIDIAGRIFISLYALFSIIAVVLLCRILKVDGVLVVAAFIPVMYGLFFNIATLNFMMGVPVTAFAVYALLRYEKDGSSGWLVFYVLLALIDYFCHAFSFAALMLVSLILFASSRAKYSKTLAFGVLAAASVIAYYLAGTVTPFQYHPLGLRYKLYAAPLYFFTYPVNYLSLGMGQILLFMYALAMLVILLNSRIRDRRLLAASFVFLALYLLLPFSISGATLVGTRALPFAILLLLVSTVPRRVDLRAMTLALLLVALAIKAVGTYGYYKNVSHETSNALDCMSNVLDNDYMLPVPSYEESNINPYTHIWGYLVLKRNVLVPYIFAGRQQPLRYLSKPAAPIQLWRYDMHKEENRKVWDGISQTYDSILLIGDDASAESAIEDRGRKVCSTGLVTLYRTYKTTEMHHEGR